MRNFLKNNSLAVKCMQMYLMMMADRYNTIGMHGALQGINISLCSVDSGNQPSERGEYAFKSV